VVGDFVAILLIHISLKTSLTAAKHMKQNEMHFSLKLSQ